MWLSLVRTLARNVKYRELPDLIGQKITVHAFDSLLDDIQNGLNISESASLIVKDYLLLRGAIAKYGIVDLRYHVSPDALKISSSGVRVLRDLALAPPSEQLEDEFDSGENFADALALTYLEDIVEETTTNSSYLLLFLRTKLPRLDAKESLKRYFQYMKSFPNDFFPREFIVEDAALSNTRMAWISKHFYW